MKRIHAVLLSGALVAIPAVSFAAPTIAYYRDGPVKAIQPGQTEEDVRSEMGRPYSTRHLSGEKHLYYRVEDNFGARSWLDVALDSDGYVIRKGELRMAE